MSNPVITLTGNLGNDPELKFTPTGTQVANFRLGVTPRVRTADGNWEDGETSWYRVTCWRALAEHAADTLTKGARVLVLGRLRIREFETQEGQRGRVAEVDADEVGVSLKFATATINRPNGAGATKPASDGAFEEPPPF